MLLRRFLIPLAATALLSSCGHSISSLPGFDDAAWRRDLRGCGGVRRTQLAALNQGREQLYGARVNSVGEFLGRPDQEELQEQSQRVYYYYVEPGAQCAPGGAHASTRRLMIRFGSLGTVTEVLYTSAPPIGQK